VSSLTEDFRDFFVYLNRYSVRYLVVGGYAVALHGYVRYTKDIDVWIDATPDNAERLAAALEAFGASVDASQFLIPDKVLFIGNPPNRIDVLTSIPGVDFVVCYEKRLEETLDGVTITLIDKTSLIAAKKASARPQDLLDAAKLEE
jgi:hypothetical protein